MEYQDIGFALEEANRLVTGALTSVVSLKDSVTSFWGGPAALSYQDILTQSIDLTRLVSLLKELEDEIAAVTS